MKVDKYVGGKTQKLNSSIQEQLIVRFPKINIKNKLGIDSSAQGIEVSTKKGT